MSPVASMQRPRFSAVPLRYLLSVAVNVVVVLGAVCAISCGIYMIERTVGILDIALRYNFSIGSFLSMVLLQLPALVEFALPVASYAAAHFVLLARRERREFVILAAAGVSTTCLVAPVIGAVTVSGLMSVLFTDAITPGATSAYRLIETAARAQILANRLPKNRFFVGEDAVLYIGQGSGRGSTVRLFQRNGGEIVSILSSDCAAPRTSGNQISLGLCGGDVYLFERPLETGARPVHGHIGETVYPFDAATLLEGRSSSRAPTLSVRELLSGEGSSRDDIAMGISRLLSALACLLAASLAVLSVAFTTIHTRIFTFLGGSLTMLVLMALRNPLADLLAAADTHALLATGAALLAAAFLLPGAMARRLDARLVAPAVVKT